LTTRLSKNYAKYYIFVVACFINESSSKVVHLIKFAQNSVKGRNPFSSGHKLRSTAREKEMSGLGGTGSGLGSDGSGLIR
jgi:hypothetical protein